MPPFCAPAPPYFLNDPAPSHEEEPEHQEDDGRSQIIALLVGALNDAEAAVAAAGENDNTLDLANQAYTSLCYDFPIVSTNALGALYSSLKSSLLEAGETLFPITRKFTAGLSYLLSVEYREQATADGRPQEDVVTSVSESADVTDSDTRSRHLLALCASVFLLAPAIRLGVARKDEGASLNCFLASYDAGTYVKDKQSLLEKALLLDDESDSEHVSRIDYSQSETGDSSDAAEVDDDDSDWEPLETEAPVSIVQVEELASTSERVEEGWGSLMEKVAHLTSSVPKEVINPSVWRDLQLTKHLIHAVSELRMLENKEAGVDFMMAAELYTGLLADHLGSECHSSSVASDLASVISALLSLVEASRDSKGKDVAKASTSVSQKRSWESLLLITLAKLCSKVGGIPICSNSAYDSISAERKSAKERANVPRTSPVFIRCLWQSTASTLLFLQEQLDNAVGSAELFLQVELVLSILCFLVKYAPGNADLGSMLVGGGFFRTALSVFMKIGSEPHTEVVRQFVLLSIATSSAAADYATRISTFRSVLLSPAFVKNSFTRPHAIIWPLLLQTSTNSASIQSSKYTIPKVDTEHEAGQELVTTLNRIVKLVEDGTSVYKECGFLKELLELYWVLQLLAEATNARSSGSFTLWRRDGFVDRAISQCQAILGGVLVQETESRSLPISSTQDKGGKKSEPPEVSEDGESDLTAYYSTAPNDDCSKEKRIPESAATSEAQVVASKAKEVLPRILLLLKQLSSLTRGSRGAKID